MLKPRHCQSRPSLMCEEVLVDDIITRRSAKLQILPMLELHSSNLDDSYLPDTGHSQQICSRWKLKKFNGTFICFKSKSWIGKVLHCWRYYCFRMTYSPAWLFNQQNLSYSMMLIAWTDVSNLQSKNIDASTNDVHWTIALCLSVMPTILFASQHAFLYCIRSCSHGRASVMIHLNEW